MAFWLPVLATLLVASVAYDPNALYAAVFLALVLGIWRLRRRRRAVQAQQPDGALAGGVAAAGPFDLTGGAGGGPGCEGGAGAGGLGGLGGGAGGAGGGGGGG